MKKEYLLVAIGASIVTSIGSVVYSIYSNLKASGMEESFKKRADEILEDSQKKIKELEDKLEKKVDGIADSLDVEVPDDIVERALNKAADAEAKASIDRVSRKIMDEYGVAVRSEVRKSVDLAYSNTKVDVKNELTKQISHIDISGIKREIVEQAKRQVTDELEQAVKTIKDTFEESLEDCKEKAADKFERDLDSISTRFSNDLERGSKIYKVLSDKLGTD